MPNLGIDDKVVILCTLQLEVREEMRLGVDAAEIPNLGILGRRREPWRLGLIGSHGTVPILAPRIIPENWETS